MKKFVSKLLIFVLMATTIVGLVFGLTACDGKVEVKIGVLQGDPTEAQQALINKYLRDVIEPEYDVKFVFSENMTEAAAERSWLEGIAAQGCQGVLTFVRNLELSVFREVCESQDLFWLVFGNPNAAQQEAWGGSTKFLGGIGQQQEEKSGMYDLTMNLLNQKNESCTMLAFTGGVFTGDPMFTDRRAGITDAIADWEKANSGKKVTLTQQDGFPGPDFFATAAANLAQKPDIVIANAAASVVLAQIANVQGNDANYKPLFGANGSTDEALLQAVEDGKITYLAAINPQVIGVSFAIMYNYIQGYTDFIPASEGFAKLSISYTAVQSAADAESIKEAPFTTAQLDSIIKSRTKNATFGDVKALIASLNA